MTEQFTKSTDKRHTITLPSRLLYAMWRSPFARAGQEALFEVRTSFVGYGAPIKVTGKTDKGKRLGTVRGSIRNNLYCGKLAIPEDTDLGEMVYIEVSLPKCSLSGKSKAIAVAPRIEVRKMAWSSPKARQGDVLTLSADVLGVEDGSDALIQVLEYDENGAHDHVADLPCEVKGKRIEVQWAYEYLGDTDEIPTEEEKRRYGGNYQPPEYFFVVEIEYQRFGEGQESGMLRFIDSMEIELRDTEGKPAAGQEYILHLPDGSERRGRLDEAGRAREENVSPGPCSVEFPGILAVEDGERKEKGGKMSYRKTKAILSKSGQRVSCKMVIPTLFVLDPEDVPDAARANPDDADSIRLWTLNHLSCLYLHADHVDPAMGWRHYRTDWEGFLVETRRNLKGYYPWTSWPKLDGRKPVPHRLYLTTLPLLDNDVENVCAGLGSNSSLMPEDMSKLSRPYPEDLPAGDKKVAAAMFLVRVDTSQLPKAVKRMRLSHSEAVLLEHLPLNTLRPYRDDLRQHRLTEEKLRELKHSLCEVRGTYRFEIIDSRVPKGKGLESPLPELLAPPPLSKVNRRRPVVPHGGLEEGPWWITVTAFDTMQEATPEEAFVDTKKERGGNRSTSPEQSPEQHLGNRLVLHAMDHSYPMPTPLPGLPPVDDPVITDISAETFDLFHRSRKAGDAHPPRAGDILSKIGEVLGKSRYREKSRWIRSFFYFSYSEDGWSGCIALALSAAAHHWRFSVESEMTDLARSSEATDLARSKEAPPLILRSHVIVGFATGSDALSEAANPLHPYQQLKEWWNGLSGTDRDEVAAADCVDIKGYSSRLGGPSERNIDLRRHRAWKTARSLQLVLGEDFDFSRRSGGKTLELFAVPPPPSATSRPVSGGAKSLPVYYGAEENMSRFHDPGVYKSLGTRICDVLLDSPVARLAVRGVSEDNDPRDRVAIVEFRRTMPKRTAQFVKRVQRTNAAHAVAGYRVIHFVESPHGDTSLSQMVLYAIPAIWK